ncbi:Stress responsive A/B Barrel Domain [Lentzea fradiae]|uniref:Stress responsive A/B Barrel Domain n=1 Tax=Lentzea fradiae TaxID=200378 RepID=A0A1G7R352_9PSEU|nr:Dabb family protein [Lentzea fradiae]SDG05157.1 Stress responsive A/B Barrel Domain [Lentzea fradiae]
MSESKFLHIGALTLREDVTDEQRAAVVDGLTGLRSSIPSLRSIEVHQDLGLRDGNADLVFVAAFDDEQGWREYSAHEAHLALVKEVLAPVLAAKVFVQAQS